MSGRAANSTVSDKIRQLVQWAFGFRYIKFGIVGASGTVVNMVVLYLAQEFVFASIAAPRQRLYVSLAVAILVATINNFSWNRIWTWADRRADLATCDANVRPKSIGSLFLRYCLASWMGMALQYGLTLWFAHFMHYLVANVLAIVVASVSNFLANDRWTFKRKS
ncbi:MAG: GtrA family protein [Betaproteobacteria bacterium]|jgi:putative flippase GtrA|nr:GtrA family protein [Betaproteobacteria bacterium]